jgi:hypothetical protein
MIKFIQYAIFTIVLATTIYCAWKKDSYTTYHKEFTYINPEQLKDLENEN